MLAEPCVGAIGCYLRDVSTTATDLHLLEREVYAEHRESEAIALEWIDDPADALTRARFVAHRGDERLGERLAEMEDRAVEARDLETLNRCVELRRMRAQDAEWRRVRYEELSKRRGERLSFARTLATIRDLPEIGRPREARSPRARRIPAATAPLVAGDKSPPRPAEDRPRSTSHCPWRSRRRR